MEEKAEFIQDVRRQTIERLKYFKKVSHLRFDPPRSKDVTEEFILLFSSKRVAAIELSAAIASYYLDRV